QVGVGRSGVEEVVELLDVLAMVALAVGQPEEALLQDRISSVPKRHGQTEPLLRVANPGNAVLAPPVGSAPGVIVGKVLPGRAVGAVVLSHGAPLPLGDVRSPTFPPLH